MVLFLKEIIDEVETGWRLTATTETLSTKTEWVSNNFLNTNDVVLVET